MRILIAEDDQKLLKSLIYIFEHNRFNVDGVSSGDEALAYAKSGEYDGMVLDIMMPGLDGLQVLKMLRAEHINTPALFLTAKTEVDQKIEGLDAGADDYLAKPFSPRELLARVRAMLRRKDNYVPELLELEGTVLNRSTYELICRSKSCALSGKEYQFADVLEELSSVTTAEDLEKQPELGDNKEELVLTFHRNTDDYTAVELIFYQYDGSYCIPVLDGVQLDCVSREDVISLKEAINSVILDSENGE